MTTTIDTASCRNRWDRVAASATNFVQLGQDDRSKITRQVPHRRYRKARAARGRAAANRRPGMPARTAENSMAGPSLSLPSCRESAAWTRGVQRGHDFLGLAHNRVQVGLILEAFRINLVDTLG